MVENNGYLRRRILMISLLLTLSAGAAFAQTTSFTYQGRLQDGGSPANGSYDLQFTLWDASSLGTQQPQPSPVTVTRTSVLVTGGIFTLQLDFGANAFPGADRFLEIGARLSGGGAFTILSPRQQINSTPYAIRSLNASSADAVTVNGVPGGSGNYIQNATTPQASANFNISGNGTAGGTLSSNIVNATTQYNIAGQRVFNIPGTENTFAGVGAGANNTSGQSNTAFGAQAGASNQTGNFSAYFGDEAGRADITGHNAFFGSYAGRSNVSGTANSFFGEEAGTTNVSGSDNAYFGRGAGLFAKGSRNSYFGAGAGDGAVQSIFTGDAKTLIGYRAEAGQNNLFNATAIGANAQVDQSNSLVLGSIAGFNGAPASVNVGIGTTAPLSKLDIAATGDGAELLRFSTERPWVFRQVRTGPSTGLQLRSTAGQKAFEITTVEGNNVATFLADSTASKVGIGTTTPAHRLSVIGGPSWTTSLWNGSMEFGNTSAIGWQANAAGWHFGIGQTNGGLVFFQTSSALGSPLSPSTYDMVLTDGGLVGIGTASPDNLLTVNGAADKPGGGSWGTFSDERLKNLKGRFTPGLRAVMQLKPLRYEYKPDNALGIKLSGEHIGFSAQAVQKIIPEAVTRNDKGYLLVNNDPILWTMLNAIKEQQKQIEQLRGQVLQMRAASRRWKSKRISSRNNAPRRRG